MEIRWLDDEEQRAWRAYRALTLLMEDTLDQQLRRDAGISHLCYSVLVFLSEAPDGRLRMTDLAQALKVARSRLTYTISRMADDGLVRREGDPSDRRGQFAVVTDAGRSTLATAAPGHVATVRGAVFDRLDPDQVRVLGEVCEIVLDGLSGPDRPSSANLPWRR
jgi:DNA-binding MarR family transcriptional regulator